MKYILIIPALFALIFCISSVEAALLENYTDVPVAGTSVTNNSWRGQTFWSPNSGLVNSIQLWFNITDLGNYTVVVQNNTGAATQPNGLNVSFGTFVPGVGTQLRPINITFAVPWQLVAGQNYTVFVYNNMTSGSDNGPWVVTAGTYPRGNFTISQNAGQTWTNGSQDMVFSLFSEANTFTVILDSPSDDSSISSTDINLSAHVVNDGFTSINATLFVWNSTGLLNRTTNVLTSTNATTWSLYGFSQGNYEWNVLACGQNVTGTLCKFALLNNSFSVLPLSILSNTFNATAYETSRQFYVLNYSTFPSILSVSAILNYNGSQYSSVTTCTDSGVCSSLAQLDVPLVAADPEIKPFFWTITTFDGSGSITSNVSYSNQTVSRISFATCSVNPSLNFTAYEEQNQTRLNPFSFDANFNYYLGLGTVYKNLSLTYTNTSEVDLCIGQNVTFYINSIIAYDAPNETIDYTPRNYFHQNYPINNITQSIPLFLLRTAASTSFILQVQDRFLLPVPGVLVNVQRCYPGENNNKTVFISRTDSNGLTTGNFEAETALYKFFITNNSQTLLEVSQCSKVVPQTVPYTIAFILGEDYTSPFTDIENVSNINETLIFNYTNNILTLTYVDTSGNFTYASLIVKSLNFSGSSQPVICVSNSTLSSGIITCNISSAGTYSASAYIYRSNQILIDQIIFTVQDFSSTVGYYGAFLGFFIILISSFIFKYNEVAGIWAVNVAVICCDMIGFIAFGKVFVTAMICISIIITAVLER